MTDRFTSGAERPSSGVSDDSSTDGLLSDSSDAAQPADAGSFGAGLDDDSSAGTRAEAASRRPRRRPSKAASRSSAGEATAEATAEAAERDPAGALPTTGADEEAAAPARRKRRRRRSKASGDSEVAGEGASASAAETETKAENNAETGTETAGEGEADRPRRKRRRRRRRGERGEEDGASGEVAEGEGDGPDRPGEAEVAEEQKPRARRRRGSRGGSRRKKEAPVELEVIPGEVDELAPAASDGLPDLPDDAEMVGADGEPARKKRRKRRSRSSKKSTEGEGTGTRERSSGTRERSSSTRERSSGRKSSKKVRSSRTKRDSVQELAPAAPAVPNQILVNAGDREETRVAVVEGEVITDFSMTVKRHHSLVNDIYRGRVVNLEPAIGAAFIDFGQGRNGFLHTSDVLTVYGEEDWSLDKLLTTHVDLEEWDGTSQPPVGDELEETEGASDEGAEGDEGEKPAVDGAENSDDSEDSEQAEADESTEEDAPAGGGRGRGRGRGRKAKTRSHQAQRRSSRQRARPRLPISDLLKKGQSVVVQVTKDAIGDKGPTLTTYISIPGRYLVLMPSMARTGVSRKIEDEKERRRLKRILESFDIPAGMGVIVRTAGVGATKIDLHRDLDYLLLLWENFGQRLNLGRGPAPLYEESDVAIRTIRDLFNESTEAVVVDDPEVHARVSEFTEKLMPENTEKVEFHEGPRPLFHHYGIEQDFEKIFARRVDLPSGGSIVFDQTEALVAIDVNSGKTRSDGFDFEDIALKTNLDAVPEIARQIRLRDLGGIIVCDFIDMMKTSNRRTVEKELRLALAPDRARSKIGRISQFGLLELTRQRLGPGMSKMLFHNCPRCRGMGKLRTVESKAGAILRRLGSALTLKGFTRVEVRTQAETIEYLKRHYSQDLKNLESKHERELNLVEVDDQIEDCVLRYLRADGREVRPGGRRKR